MMWDSSITAKSRVFFSAIWQCEVLRYNDACPTGCVHWYQSFAIKFDCTYRISLSGPSSTKALPAGPALPQTATVTSNGAPVANRAVSISTSSGTAISGYTNAEGVFQFTYKPPLLLPIEDKLTATCADCSNKAEKTITVHACEVCTTE